MISCTPLLPSWYVCPPLPRSSLLEWSRLVPSFPISLVAFSETRLPSEERVGVLEDDDGDGDDDVARAQESWQVAHLAPTRVPMVPATICAGWGALVNRPEKR